MFSHVILVSFFIFIRRLHGDFLCHYLQHAMRMHADREALINGETSCHVGSHPSQARTYMNAVWTGVTVLTDLTTWTA